MALTRKNREALFSSGNKDTVEAWLKGLGPLDFHTDSEDVEDLKSRKSKCQKTRAIKMELLAAFEEYVKEAEHQDGFGYWDNFETLGEAMTDLGIYIQNREENSNEK